MENYLLYGFIIGLTSNLHCIGMCGPIALAVPVNRSNNFTIISGILQYNLGRIISYSTLGLIVGSVGLSISSFGFLQWLSIIAGILMIVYAWRKYLRKLFGSHIPDIGINSLIGKGLGRIIKSESRMKLFLLGSLNGLLPCGMVYLGLMNALITGNALDSSLAMTAFGIGTLPSMIAVAFAANKISNAFRMKLNRIVPYILTLVGILIILRGMNLDIPYISPRIELVKTADHTEKVEMSCCHSNSSCEKK